MNLLKQKIIEKIKKEGPITFETFMDMALYYPELGYYTSPGTVTGRKGDFYTSPHLHQVFGAMIGRQLEEMWEIMGRPSDFHAVEIGAGAGYLCKDILDYLSKLHKATDISEGRKDFFESLTYVIVELNPAVEEKQKILLADLAEKVTWVRSLNEFKQTKSRTNIPVIKGCILSNELLDAFPVHIVEMEDKTSMSRGDKKGNENQIPPNPPLVKGGLGGFSDELKEIYVTHNGNNFIEQKQDVSSTNLISYFKKFSINIPRGYRTEINLKIKDWLKEIYGVLSAGFILTIDYGYTVQEYYDEDRAKGTLLCYYKHRVNEIFYENIGKQDITAHVNFSSLKKWGDELGLKTIGYCPQGIFLIALGIDEVIAELYGSSSDYFFEVSKIKGLILPQGMGESHKVMIQYKGEGSPELRGFSIRNQIDNL